MTAHGNGNNGGEPTPRTADSFPPLLDALTLHVDEASACVLVTGRATLAIYPTEITLPFPLVELMFHTILGMRVRQSQAVAARGQLERDTDRRRAGYQ